MSAGENVIRDPGQKFETGLVLFYLVAAVVMLVNGVMTHSQSVQSYQELTGEGVEDDLEDESFYDESEGDEER